jgi:hypothetical protein
VLHHQQRRELHPRARRVYHRDTPIDSFIVLVFVLGLCLVFKNFDQKQKTKTKNAST